MFSSSSKLCKLYRICRDYIRLGFYSIRWFGLLEKWITKEKAPVSCCNYILPYYSLKTLHIFFFFIRSLWQFLKFFPGSWRLYISWFRKMAKEKYVGYNYWILSWWWESTSENDGLLTTSFAVHTNGGENYGSRLLGLIWLREPFSCPSPFLLTLALIFCMQFVS